MKSFFKKTAVFMAGLSLVYFAFIIHYSFVLPESFFVSENSDLSLDGKYAAVCIERSSGSNETAAVAAGNGKSAIDQSAKLSLFGVFPIKEATVREVGSSQVGVLGTPFGIKMFTQGVLVVSVVSIGTESGNKSPAEEAGIKKGDIISSIGGHEMNSNEDVASAIGSSNGKALEVKLTRKNMEFSVMLTPVFATDGTYKSGMWVRDSSAGIGTMTFFIPETLSFAGLGHPICDVDTGDIIPLGSGEICSATIYGVNRGTAGAAGELRGRLLSEQIGSLLQNSETGVYGKLTSTPKDAQVMNIAFKQDIKEGDAEIFTTVDGSQPKLYKIKIEKVSLGDQSLTKNMVIKITDPELLQQTGGIVQGMSGSPIIQNDCLVGAVTHVFINDPQRGYGIFAENMEDCIKALAQAS